MPETRFDVVHMLSHVSGVNLIGEAGRVEMSS